MATIQLNANKISKAFIPVLLSKARYIVCFGGRSSSKTKSLYIKFILRSFETKHVRILYCQKVKANIRDGLYSGFKKTITDLGLENCFKFYEGDHRIHNIVTGHWLIPRGLDDPEQTKAIEDITDIWIDEINLCEKKDFTKLNRLLKTSLNNLQFVVSFNPVSLKHWLREYFFSEEDAYKAHPRFTDILIHHSTIHDNDFIDKEAYIKEIISDANGDDSLLECDLWGRWGIEKVDNLFIYGLNDKRNIVPFIELRNNLFQWISIDFNTNPMTAIVAQYGYDSTLKKDFIEIIDEVVVRRKKDGTGVGIYELCDEIKRRYDIEWCIFVGDAQGWSGNVNTRGAKSSWELINEYLELSKNQNKTPRGKRAVLGKGYVSDKRYIANFLLQTYPIFRIASHCVNLIEDIKTVTATSEGKMNKTKDLTKSHLLDCFTDLLITLVRYKEIHIDIKKLKEAGIEIDEIG